MIELIIMAVLAFAAIVVVSVLGSVFSLVLGLVVLPFRIVGWGLKALAFVLALPFLALFGVIGFAFLGAGMLVFLLPAVPFALIAFAAWWLVRRAAPRSRATVTS